jgi:hypothetical protein
MTQTQNSQDQFSLVHTALNQSINQHRERDHRKPQNGEK